MFSEKVSIESATSDITYVYSDVVDLHEKRYSNKPIFLKVDIGGSTTSGTLNVTYSISEKFAGTYANVITGSGSSLLLTSGNSVGGTAGNGSWYIPLSLVPHSGCTKWLTGVPYIKIGACASLQNVDCSMYLCVG